MRVLGPDTADIRVFTYKEGLLSKVAHDLELRVGRFEIAVDPNTGSVRARIEARSLEVVNALRNGVQDPNMLTPSNKAEILDNLRKDVLHTDKWTSIVFESTSVSDTLVTGRLSLHGITREIQVTVRQEADARVGEVRLDQRDFGIRPYSAMLGALKVQPEVLVRVRMPLV